MSGPEYWHTNNNHYGGYDPYQGHGIGSGVSMASMGPVVPLLAAGGGGCPCGKDMQAGCPCGKDMQAGCPCGKDMQAGDDAIQTHMLHVEHALKNK
jgi:hypothetical protein